MFSRVLIANRGEIACRIIRTCRRLGIRAIVVYSKADANALHASMADEAVNIGPAPVRESYLSIDNILLAARRCGAEAIHPGYGFLSENAEFAEACAGAGITFIGPPIQAIRAMGSKSESKRLMAAAGVPLVPGYHDDDQSDRALSQAASEIGYPVLVKASAGGGGKGMRIVENQKDFMAAIEGARREAVAAFGDGRLLVEKYLVRPRHVEVQVFADQHGNVVHLHDRDCSIQRRHQKVIEEAPAPGVERETRRRMSEAAIAAARAVGYVGAGTVEFLLAEGNFFFIEMNTRLQVEHPVTELITGIDLVEWQLLVASGKSLPLGQPQIASRGHAMEARLYAEDPDNGFLPSIGRIDHLSWPPVGEGERIDTGIRQGDAITVHYDPMIAKLIAWGQTREIAAQKLAAMLCTTLIAGPVTNARFLVSLLRHPAFIAGDVDTGFIPRHASDLVDSQRRAPDPVVGIAAAAVILSDNEASRARALTSDDPYSPWLKCDGWRLNGDGGTSLLLRDGERLLDVRVTFSEAAWTISVDDGQAIVFERPELATNIFTAVMSGASCQARVVIVGRRITVIENGRFWRLEREDVLARGEAAATSHERIVSPMPGIVIRVVVEDGAHVKKGAALVVVEAMKMEHTIGAPADGTIGQIHYRAGDHVTEGAELMEFEAAS